MTAILPFRMDWLCDKSFAAHKWAMYFKDAANDALTM
jgi:hypothetical protein